MRVLLGAYGCMPNAGSEPGVGWGWASHLAARGLDVTVLTKVEARDGIERYRKDHPDPALEMVYVPVERARSGSALHYAMWHRNAARVGRELHRARPFDVAHHVSFTSVHVPTQLWRVGVPTIFGPVGGGQTAPEGLLRYLGAGRRSERVRTLLTRALPLSPWHRGAMRRMSAVLGANAATLALVRAMGRADVRPMFDIALPESFYATGPRSFAEEEAAAGTARLLWVGRVLPRKGLPLALDALQAAASGATLTIMGEAANPDAVRRMIAERGLAERVTWAGHRLPWEAVRAAYLEHDALLFTSLRETCGAQLLEAMALGLPVITLDLHGAHDLVPAEAGFKVAVTDGRTVAQDVAAAIDRLAGSGAAERAAMSAAGWTFARRNTWTERAAQGEALYREILGRAG